MNKKQATQLSKELSVYGIRGNLQMAIVPSNPQNRIAQGYQLHITKNLDVENQLALQLFAQKHNLAIFKESNKIIIYKPLLIAPI
jgi:hypothetical protein